MSAELILGVTGALVGITGVYYCLGKIKEQRPTIQEAMSDLSSADGEFHKKRQLLLEKIDTAAETIRKNVLVNEKAALEAMKQKKRFENQVHKTNGLLSTIGLQKQQLEDANSYKEVVEKMSVASRALQTFHQQFGIQYVYDLVEDTQEQGELLNNIYWTITAEPADFGMDYDEDELMNQIEVFKEEELKQQLLQIGKPPAC